MTTPRPHSSNSANAGDAGKGWQLGATVAKRRVWGRATGAEGGWRTVTGAQVETLTASLSPLLTNKPVAAAIVVVLPTRVRRSLVPRRR